MIKGIKYFLEAIIVYFFFLFGKILGITQGRRVFSTIFRTIGPFFKSTKTIDKNLERFTKENFYKKDKEIIKYNMWANYGMTFIEYMFLEQFRKNNNHIKIEGEKILNKISRENKPVIFVSGHFANFELMSMEITKKNVSLATIYRPLNNFFINPLMEYLRKKYICENQIQKGLSGVKESIKFIEKGTSIALMIDQRVSEGSKIKFFGDEAFTTTLPAQLALKYNLEIVPVFILRKSDNHFEMKVFDPIDSKKYKNKINLTLELNHVLENMIKINPDQWIWTHNRWK